MTKYQLNDVCNAKMMQEQKKIELKTSLKALES